MRNICFLQSFKYFGIKIVEICTGEVLRIIFFLEFLMKFFKPNEKEFLVQTPFSGGISSKVQHIFLNLVNLKLDFITSIIYIKIFLKAIHFFLINLLQSQGTPRVFLGTLEKEVELYKFRIYLEA